MATLARGFSRQPGITHFTTRARHQISSIKVHGFTYTPALHPYPGTTNARAGLPSCVTPSLNYYDPGSRAEHQQPPRKVTISTEQLAKAASSWTRHHGYGNINPFSIDYACRPRLRPRLTLGGQTCPRNPWSYGGGDSHSSITTHACILTCTDSTPAHATASTPAQRSPTHHVNTHNAAASAVRLAPLHYRRRTTRPVSYYALFQGWLLLSQPPGCLSRPTSFPTQRTLRDLSRRSGLFPSRP